MNGLDTLFEQKLRARIVDGRNEIRENLGDGCAQDVASYREWVGYLRALKEVEDWCGEVAHKLNER